MAEIESGLSPLFRRAKKSNHTVHAVLKQGMQEGNKSCRKLAVVSNTGIEK